MSKVPALDICEPDMSISRIAMWSGPRNISTALMRAFENRDDCSVVDEPFYGVYLRETGIEHPGRELIIQSMDCDWQSVARTLCECVPAPCKVFYQKHMTQHIVPKMDMGFAESLTNCFLVREPRRIIASYVRVRPQFTLEELGFPQQLALFERLTAAQGKPPPVIDSTVILTDPRRALDTLCAALGIPFSERMLSWPAGRRASDGVWAPHWYASVEASRGFERPEEIALEHVVIPPQYEALCEEAEDIYSQIAKNALV
jgi:hypothetical protein